jgi:uncharacterized protein YhfF
MTAHLTVEQKRAIHRLRGRGLSLRQVAREVGCTAPGVVTVLERTPMVPARPDRWLPGQGLYLSLCRHHMLWFGRTPPLTRHFTTTPLAGRGWAVPLVMCERWRRRRRTRLNLPPPGAPRADSDVYVKAGRAAASRSAGRSRSATLYVMGDPVNDAELPLAEFAFPGALRDALVAAILSGRKVSTTSLCVEYEVEGAALPVPGQRSRVVDSRNQPVAVIETTRVDVVRLGDVDIEHALDEGEGFTSVAEWRAGHETFWHSDEMRDVLGDPVFRVDDDTCVVLERFRVVEWMDASGAIHPPN